MFGLWLGSLMAPKSEIPVHPGNVSEVAPIPAAFRIDKISLWEALERTTSS